MALPPATGASGLDWDVDTRWSCLIHGILKAIKENVLFFNMRSHVLDVMPAVVRRSLAKLGADLSIARRKRDLTTAMMCERVGVSKVTWQRMEEGDPSVALAAYAQALFVLGFGAPFSDLIDQRVDDQGLLLDLERLPRRVVPPRSRQSARKRQPAKKAHPAKHEGEP